MRLGWCRSERIVEWQRKYMGHRRIEELKGLLPCCLTQDRHRIEARLEKLTRRRQPAKRFHRVLDDLFAKATASRRHREYRATCFPSIGYPAELPIVERKNEILEAVRSHQVVVIAGETGSGKTTQIPKICLEAGRGVAGKIGCTQPRRVAALSISRRIAEELDVTEGKGVGHKIRFNDQSGPETAVKMMTDGILLAELQGDKELLEYDTIIIDEAHERSLNIDFLLGHLRRLLPRRPDLKVIVTSATIDTESFSEAFGGAPIIEVSGRLYPVDVEYAPLDADSEASGEVTYIDAAVEHAEKIVKETRDGDLLIFMPSERDIRETRDQLEGRNLRQTEVIPLFGRLSSSDQQRVFAPSSRRKIIVATNIAETSLTIPGIRYVIDPGLARVSRYNPRTRTHRLPIERVAQSSADQRLGRSGRVENGVCIRLFSEEDYQERPRYTQPEIQRANLAEVILRMKAFDLGDIETFPFINPPQKEAIHSGYRLLQELGALSEKRELTSHGRDLARLPIDPTIGRMVLQARHEGALQEVLVVAAGLSIQDPRERPMDRQDAADEAHKQFQDPNSDFLTLLNIWNAFHDQWERLKTQNQLRKFCRGHFLSFMRMREWVDIHHQLTQTLEELELFDATSQSNSYAAIHRSILTGLLGHIAERTDRNIYRAAGNRQVMVFPGSALFDQKASKKGGRKKKEDEEGGETTNRSANPDWIVAGEIVETSRVYARTVAGIRPDWIVELGSHLCRVSYEEPHWSEKGQRVLARERTRLFGLDVRRQWVPYGKVSPREATEIFIQSALVEERISGDYAFLEHNRRLRQKIETYQTRMRRLDLPDLFQALFEFYSKRIEGVSSLDDLNRLLRDRQQEDPEFLKATEEDLISGEEVGYDSGEFPDSVTVGGQEVRLAYTYAPGEQEDGVTVKLPLELARSVQPATLEWAVPGFREEKIAHLLRSLPKTYRRQLIPIPQRAKEIAKGLDPKEGTLVEALSWYLRDEYGIEVPVSAWQPEAVPHHLWTRIELLGKKRKPIASGRDLEAITAQVETKEPSVDPEAWRRVANRWEKYDLKSWSFDDMPEQIEVSDNSDLPILAYPGLHYESQTINLCLFRRREEAERATGVAFQYLCERALQRDLAWLQKDLRQLNGLKALYMPIGSVETLQAEAFEHLKAYLFRCDQVLPLRRATYDATLAQARSRLPGLARELYGLLSQILELRQELTLRAFRYPGLEKDLERLLPGHLLYRFPFERVRHLSRYLKAMRARAERAKTNPPKDRQKAERVRPYEDVLTELRGKSGSDRARNACDEFAWMVEELKVSCFAPELGTAYPISGARLDRKAQEIRKLLAG